MSKLVLTKQQNEYWSFVLDNDTANEISNTRNDLLTIGNQCHFKTSNGANLIQKQDIFPTDVTIISGSNIYNPIDTHTLFNNLITEGYFDWITAQEGGGGKDRFDELLDTFPYIGKDGMCIVVDETQMRLIAVPFHNVSKSTDLTDMPTVLVGNQMLITNPTGTTYQYAPIPTPPETFLNAIGYFIYDDLITKTSPIPFTANNRVKITNDAEGDGTDSSEAPFGIGSVWDSDNGQMDFSALSIGDMIDFRMRLDTTISSNQQFQIIFKSGVGSSNPIENIIFTTISGKTSGLDSETFGFSFAISDQSFIDYPSELYLLSDGSGTITVYRFYFRIIRKNINLVEIGAEGLNLKEDKINKQPIIGNETNEDFYPSVKDVVDYVLGQGASSLQATLLKGHISDQPMFLQKDPNNFLAFFEPTSIAEGFENLLTDSNNNNLHQQWIPSIYDISMGQQTLTNNLNSYFSIRPNGIWMRVYNVNLSDNSFTEYTLQVESNDVFIQKRTNTAVRKARLKLDLLTADTNVQFPAGDGTLAYQSYVDTRLTTLTTDNIAEGINPSRLYFAASRVLATLLSGLSTATGGTILPSDTIIQSFGKLQYQISNLLTSSGVISALGYTPENIANKSDLITDTSSSIIYPSAKGFTGWIKSSLFTFLTSQSTLIDADYLPIFASAVSNETRRITWANIKTLLNALYQTKLNFTPENINNKVNDIASNENSQDKYLSVDGVGKLLLLELINYVPQKNSIDDTDWFVTMDGNSKNTNQTLWTTIKTNLLGYFNGYYRLKIRTNIFSYASLTGGAYTPNIDLYDYHQIDGNGLTNNITINNPTGTKTSNMPLQFIFKDNNVIARNITWGGDFSGTASFDLPLITTLNTKIRILFQWDSVDSKWYLVGLV